MLLVSSFLGGSTKSYNFSIENGTLHLSRVLIILLGIRDLLFMPVTRTTALLSLESAVFSIVLGRVYRSRFASIPEPQIAHYFVSGKHPHLRYGTHTFFELYQGLSYNLQLHVGILDRMVFLALLAIYAAWSIILITTFMTYAVTLECTHYTVPDGSILPPWLLVILCRAVIHSLTISFKAHRSFLALGGISMESIKSQDRMCKV
jgi:hypothetical protein